MIAEIGHFALILALVFALMQVLIPSVGIMRTDGALVRLAKPLVWGQFFWLLLAFLVLAFSFLNNDFSLVYVANNSNRALPIIYKISAVWGAHEGSLLLWALILGVWTVAVTLFSKRLPILMSTQILVILGLVSIGFLLFLLFTSNPFLRIFPIPPDGNELNPLLQDFGLAVHPPMLYMGYVGMAVPFAFVLSALIGGTLDSTWLRWSRPWVLVAWAFLTAGITLGSWWAYYELGWGGWWFWDPVENASFMPWLLATALVHSLSVAEKRSAFKSWTVLLAIGGFSLSLLGTFLVRSGVLTSVHAFATDPERGLFILLFLTLVIGGSFLLYAYRVSLLKEHHNFSFFSRESGLLINNITLITAMFTVLLGTLYPLLLDALNLGKISVGAPYFSAVFIPIMLPAVVLMAIIPFVRWKSDNFRRVFSQLKKVWLLSIILLPIFVYLLLDNIALLIAVMLFTWISLHSLWLVVRRFRDSKHFNLSFLAMISAHIGIAVFILGATMVTQFGIEKDVKLSFGEQVNVAGYDFYLEDVRVFEAKNYSGHRAKIIVRKNNKELFNLAPEKRQYTSSMPMTEAAINTQIFNDIYVSLGEPLSEKSWSVRIYYKPFVRLIWLGGILITLGALLAAFDGRYRFKIKTLIK